MDTNNDIRHREAPSADEYLRMRDAEYDRYNEFDGEREDRELKAAVIITVCVLTLIAVVITLVLSSA